MSAITINGTRLYYELQGGFGEPLVLVHGSWVSHHSWNAVVGMLAEHFRVLVYDRRGHSQSERPIAPATMEMHAADLGALLESLTFAPAHVAGSSYGAIISLRLAGRRPELFKSLIIHEPPLMTLLEPDSTLRPQLEGFGERIAAVYALLEQGRNEEAARTFVETIAFGPGMWDRLGPPLREIFIFNAPTFLHELRDPEKLGIDLSPLQNIRFPVLLTTGTQSPPLFGRVAALLEQTIPNLRRKVFDGASHAPHLTHPDAYVATVKEFVSRVEPVT